MKVKIKSNGKNKRVGGKNKLTRRKGSKVTVSIVRKKNLDKISNDRLYMNKIEGTWNVRKEGEQKTTGGREKSC